jgi:AcrR family transcriptional regulator
MTTSPAPLRRRDATRTRQLLLDAARSRFAVAGYAATTVRDIADDAGVNVALISRYFDSKEGLFAACLTAAVEEMREVTGDAARDQIAEKIAEQVTGSGTEGRPHETLLLLLRSSGDERADEIRLAVLQGYGERLAATAGWQPGTPDDDALILRAQLVLCASIGMALLRTAGLQPLATAGEEDLIPPLRDLVDGLLPR